MTTRFLGRAWCLTFVLPFLLAVPTSAQNGAAFPKQGPGVKPPVLRGFAPLSDEELREGWIRLFDGVSLFGWRTMQSRFHVRGGVLINDPDHAGMLRYTSRLLNGQVVGQRRRADGRSDWTPFTILMESAAADQAGFFEITLESGQYRDIKFLPKDMKPLLDGKTLRGWKINPKAEAIVENGALRLTGGSGSLESEGVYADFLLQLEYRTDKPVNSGVFFRCIPGEIMNGYECQIFNNPPGADYKKFIGTETGGLFRRQVGRNVGPQDGQWNHLTIFARDAQISTWVNGIQVADWVDERDPDPNPRRGRRIEAGTIQLQGHDPETDILFRNIRIGAF